LKGPFSSIHRNQTMLCCNISHIYNNQNLMRITAILQDTSALYNTVVLHLQLCDAAISAISFSLWWQAWHNLLRFNLNGHTNKQNSTPWYRSWCYRCPDYKGDYGIMSKKDDNQHTVEIQGDSYRTSPMNLLIIPQVIHITAHNYDNNPRAVLSRVVCGWSGK
jgi:hypothetical protein